MYRAEADGGIFFEAPEHSNMWSPLLDLARHYKIGDGAPLEPMEGVSTDLLLHLV